MARIRTIKPEAFTSESLSEVSVEAERSFFGLLTQADDRGRHRDNAAVIAGQLWPLRPEHTAVHVEGDLEQLHRAGLLCRYAGCDGKRYLHIPTWDHHQKINKPSESRLPICRTHTPKGTCGSCGTIDCSSKQTPPPDNSGRVPGGFREGSNHSETDMAGSAGIVRSGSASTMDTTSDDLKVSASTTDEAAGQELVLEDSRKPPVVLQEASSPGSRIVDLGSSVLSERGAEAPAAESEPITAQSLVAEWIDHVPKRPPGKVIGQASASLKQMLDEGIDPQDVRRGLALWVQKGLNPTALPSVVNQVMNANGAQSNVVDIAGRRSQPTSGPDANLAEHAALIARLEAMDGQS